MDLHSRPTTPSCHVNSTRLVDDLAGQVSQIDLGVMGHPSEINRDVNRVGGVGGARRIDDDLEALGRQLRNSSLQKVYGQTHVVNCIGDDTVEGDEALDSHVTKTPSKEISSTPKENTVDPLEKPNLLRAELYTHQNYSFKVTQQCNNILFGLRGFNCHGLAYQIEIDIRPIPASAYSREPGINNTVETLPLPTLNICAHCHGRERFHEAEELVKHLNSHCGNNDVVRIRERHVNVPHQNPHQLAAPTVTRTGVRGAGQPFALAPSQPLPGPGSSSCNDRNKQKNASHQCQHAITSQGKVPPVLPSHNNETAVIRIRDQRQSPKRRYLNQHYGDQGNIRVGTEVRISPGPSIPATLPPTDPTQDRSRSRVRATRRSKIINQHPRSPNNNCDNETHIQPHPTSSQFPCRIPDCTRVFNTITDFTEHSISDHDLERRWYWELNPEPICLVCGAVADEFKKHPSQLFRHVFECKRRKKLKVPNWKPILMPRRHGMPRDCDKATWDFHVNNDPQGKRKTQVQNRDRTRSASVTRSNAPSREIGVQSDRVLRSASQNRVQNKGVFGPGYSYYY